MCTDMCADMCIGMCVDMCTDMFGVKGTGATCNLRRFIVIMIINIKIIINIICCS